MGPLLDGPCSSCVGQQGVAHETSIGEATVTGDATLRRIGRRKARWKRNFTQAAVSCLGILGSYLRMRAYGRWFRTRCVPGGYIRNARTHPKRSKRALINQLLTLGMDILAASANCRFSSSVGYLTSPIGRCEYNIQPDACNAIRNLERATCVVMWLQPRYYRGCMLHVCAVNLHLRSGALRALWLAKAIPRSRAVKRDARVFVVFSEPALEHCDRLTRVVHAPTSLGTPAADTSSKQGE